jgi:hypothetical protein
MSFLDKIKFWKRDDEFNFDQLAEKEMGSSNPFTQPLPGEQHDFTEPNPFAESQQGSQFNQPPRSSMYPNQPTSPSLVSSGMKDRDIELINSKLDTIKAMLNSIEQRISNLEKGASKPPQRLW